LLKLVYVVHQWFPESYTGTEQYARAVAVEAKRRGDEVTIVSLVPWFHEPRPAVWLYEENYQGLRVFRIRYWQRISPNEALRDYRNPLLAAAFRRVIWMVKPDVCHFFHVRNLGADLVHVAVDRWVRTVVHLTDFWYLCPRFTLMRSDGALCSGPPEGGMGCIPCHRPDLMPLIRPKMRDAVRSFAGSVHCPGASGAKAEEVAALLQRPEYLRATLERADEIIAPSLFLRQMFERNGVGQGRIRHIPYGLEPGIARQARGRRRSRRIRVGFIGNLSPWKGAHVAIDAVRAVRGDITLRLYGRRDRKSFGNYHSELRARAKDDQRIRFSGQFNHERLAEILAKFDLLVVPSVWYENTPFVILEARQAGLPVIASRLGGLAEAVEEDRDGWLFEPGNAADLAARLQACVDAPQALAGLDSRPPPDIAENYDRILECYGRTPCSA
jgi:glycosyltransferase involved in cell wall biosynthesis